ncbi:ABC transporter, partial [Planoprotostelium fungivorum]
DAGEVTIGKTVKIAHVAQICSDQLDNNNSVYKEISEGMDYFEINRKVNMRGYLATFNFKGSSQNKFVSSLSGGERNCLQLAKMLKRGSNVLRSLEEALGDYLGSAVIISHDRWFLDRMCTHIMAFEGEGYVHFHDGNRGNTL